MFELCNGVTSQLNYALRLWVPWHLHEADSSFGQRSNGSIEDRVCYVVKIPVEVAWIDARMILCSESTLGPLCILPSMCCPPSIISILWSIDG